LFVAKVAIHPREDLAKTGSKPDMKTKTLIISFYIFGYKNALKPNIKLWNFFTISIFKNFKCRQ
jgi:hypothetical protein